MKLKVHPAGVVVFAAAFLFWDSHMILASMIALLIHEAGHLAVMWLCGMRECTIELTPFGGMADPQRFENFKPWKRAAASAAGVLASAFVSWGCFRWAPRTPFWYCCFQSNFSLALLNSFPAWPLDGARVLAAAACCIGCEQKAKRLLSAVTAVLGGLMSILGLVGIWHGIINPSLLVTGPYLCYAANAEKVSDKVRQMDRIGKKLMNGTFVPVEVMAGTTEPTGESSAILLGRMQADRYHLLIKIDPKNGLIQKCYTETEVLKSAFHMEESDGYNPVDKANTL